MNHCFSSNHSAHPILFSSATQIVVSSSLFYKLYYFSILRRSSLLPLKWLGGTLLHVFIRTRQTSWVTWGNWAWGWGKKTQRLGSPALRAENRSRPKHFTSWRPTHSLVRGSYTQRRSWRRIRDSWKKRPDSWPQAGCPLGCPLEDHSSYSREQQGEVPERAW